MTTSQAAAAILASSASSTTTPVPSLVLPGVPELESNELEQRIGEVVTDAAIEQLGQRWEGAALQREEEGDGVNWFATTVGWRWLIYNRHARQNLRMLFDLKNQIDQELQVMGAIRAVSAILTILRSPRK